MVSFWSVLSATLWFVLAFLVLCVLRGHTEFLMRHGTTAWSIAVVLTIVRLLLPLDSERMFVLRSYKLLPMLRRALDYQPVAGISVSLFLKVLWLAGSLCGIGFIVYGIARDSRRLQRIPALPLTSQVQDAVLQCNISTDTVCVTTAVTMPMSTGLLHPTIYLPDGQYDEADLVWILKHEMSHIAGHDAWLRLGFLVFRCVFWWNPLVHLAQKSVDEILELRCDKVVLSSMSTDERIAYVEALHHVGHQTSQTILPLIGANTFVQPNKGNALLLRVKTALDDPPRWDKTAIAALVLSLVLFAVSYAFIPQPAELTPPEDTIPMSVVSPGATYLKRTPSGDYEFWSDGEFVGILSADMLDDELLQTLEVFP